MDRDRIALAIVVMLGVVIGLLVGVIFYSSPVRAGPPCQTFCWWAGNQWVCQTYCGGKPAKFFGAGVDGPA